ncbi:hypothetical protein J6590_010995 [Homalodisca vitripennis]|nr:hypothetical protein J6590_010995 [Homalodisca vitripennis]
MATTGILPSYQRFLNGAPVPTSTRRSFRPREKYLILLVFLTFGVVCFGAFFFLPEFRGAGTVNSVYKVYRHMQKAGPELLIPPPPHGDEASETPGKLALGLLRHNIESQQDPHRLEDRARLLAKIEEEDRKNQKVLERPDIADSLNKASVSSSTKTGEFMKPMIESVVDMAEIAPKIQTVPPLESDHYPVIYGGEDKDPTARIRRDKIKEKLDNLGRNVRSGKYRSLCGLFGASFWQNKKTIPRDSSQMQAQVT